LKFNKVLPFLALALTLCFPAQASIKQVYQFVGANGLPGLGGTQWSGGLTNTQNNNVEAVAAIKIMNAGGTISRMGWYLSANTYSVNLVYTSRVNSSAGNQTATVTAGATGFFVDSSNSDSVSAGDTIAFQGTQAAGTGAGTLQWANYVFSPASNFRTYGHSSIASFVAGADRYQALSDFLSSTTESDVQAKIKAAGNLKKSRVYLRNNASVTNITLRIRINSSNGNNTVTCTALTTGAFEDTSSTDAVSVNDLVNWNMTGATVGNAVTTSFQIGHEYTDAAISQVMSQGGGTIADGVTSYSSIGRGSANTTEANRSSPVDFDYTVSTMETKVTTNSTTSSSTLTFRVGSSDSALTLTITSGTTGFFADTTHSVTGSSGDNVNYKWVNGGGGAFTFRFIGMVMQETQVSTGYAHSFSMIF